MRNIKALFTNLHIFLFTRFPRIWELSWEDVNGKHHMIGRYRAINNMLRYLNTEDNIMRLDPYQIAVQYKGDDYTFNFSAAREY